jgi:hypothetical protein
MADTIQSTPTDTDSNGAEIVMPLEDGSGQLYEARLPTMASMSGAVSHSDSSQTHPRNAKANAHPEVRPRRRLRPETLDRETALKEVKAVAMAVRDSMK